MSLQTLIISGTRFDYTYCCLACRKCASQMGEALCTQTLTLVLICLYFSDELKMHH